MGIFRQVFDTQNVIWPQWEDALSGTELRPHCKLLFDHPLFRNMTVISQEICLIGVVSSQNISHVTSTSWLTPASLSLPGTASSTSLSRSFTARDSRASAQVLTVSSCSSRGITSLKTETVFMHEYVTGMLERSTFWEHNTSILVKENMHERKKDKS